MRKNNEKITTEQIDELVCEKIKEYEKQHLAWIDLKHGNTYIGFDVYDYVTEKSMSKLKQLLDFMCVKYAVYYPFMGDGKSYLILEGEDKARADFIQKYIDNGYRLSW